MKEHVDEQEDESLRSDVNRSLGWYYSEVQKRHNDQMELLTKLRDQLDKAGSRLLNSQSKELDDFREMMRLIAWKIESATGTPTTDETESSDAVEA